MVGTPEEDLLGWLEREEIELGFDTVERGLRTIDAAREMLYGELGYDVSKEQYEGLTSTRKLRSEELPKVSVKYTTLWHEEWQGYEATYRDVITGRFVSPDDVRSALAIIR